MHAHAKPTFFSPADLRLLLQQWDCDALRFERRFGEIVPDSLRRTIYLETASSVKLLHLVCDDERATRKPRTALAPKRILNRPVTSRKVTSLWRRRAMSTKEGGRFCP